MECPQQVFLGQGTLNGNTTELTLNHHHHPHLTQTWKSIIHHDGSKQNINYLFNLPHR